ncbi:MAG: hypothetical protein ACREUY_01130 [Burkholderiales bacterium]
MYVTSRNELGQALPLLTAATGAAQLLPRLISGKPHNSPWGFLYDEYPRRIYELEKIVRSYTGEELPPDPDPGQAKPRGGPAYQASMLDIVPRYVPGSESQIASYDRRLNEAGGAYERTYQSQQETIASFEGARAAPMPAQAPTAAVAVSPQTAIPSTVTVTPQRQLPRGFPTVLPITQASMTMLPLLAIGGLALVLMMTPGKKH